MDQTIHRPWPLPTLPWVMSMTWHDLLFLHWPLPASVLRPLIPPELVIDTFGGQAWIAVVPFQMSGVRLRDLPAFPGTGAFPELNVRTYVRYGEKGGVFFFSLDAGSRLAVRAARIWFGLPYYDAWMRCRKDGETIGYTSHRKHRGAVPAGFEACYTPSGAEFRASRGTLEHWLVERYCLFASRGPGRTSIGEIDHDPWTLQLAEIEVSENRMVDGLGIELPDIAPIAHFVRRLDVVAWSLQPLSTEPG